MKFSKSTVILDKQVVDLQVTPEVAIERLIAQNGLCRDNDKQGSALIFYCTQNGEFSVYNASRRSPTDSRIYSVRGEIFAENEKTKAVIYTVHDRATRGSRWILLFVSLLIAAVYIFFQFLTHSPIDHSLLTGYALLCTLLFVGAIIFTHRHTNKEEQHKDEDIHIMKTEMLRRLEAVNRWDD